MWAIVELMGHVKMAGYVTEEERFGGKMGRIDIPHPAGDVTQYFGGSSVYRVTPCTEDVARAFAAGNRPQPVSLWQLELPMPRSSTRDVPSGGQDDDYDPDLEF